MLVSAHSTARYVIAGFLGLAMLLAPVYAGKMLAWQDLLFATIAQLLVIALLLGTGALGGRGPALPLWWYITPAAVLALCSVSAMTTVYGHASLIAVWQLTGYLVIFWLAATLAWSGRSGLWLAYTIFGGAVLSALWALREYMITVLRGGDVSWRAFGPFNNPNSLAGYLIVVLPLALAILIRGARRPDDGTVRWEAIAGLFGSLLVGMALLLTGSKAGILAGVIGLVVFALTAPPPGSAAARKARWAAIIGVLAVVGMSALLPPVRARIIGAFSTQAGSTAFRWHTWLGTLDMIRARPLLGFGPGTFQYAYPRYAHAGYTQEAHQSYLQWAAEMGIPAAAALLAALVMAFLLLQRSLRTSAGTGRLMPAAALAGLTAFSLHNLADYPWYVAATGGTVWALVGLGVASRWRLAGTPVRVERRLRWLVLIPILLGCLSGLVWAGAGLRAQSLAARADAQARRGLYNIALRSYERAIALAPRDADLYVQLARVQEAIGRGGDRRFLEAAVRSRLEAARLRPTHAENYRYLGQVYERLEDLPAAIAATQRAIQYQPLYPKALAQLGRLYAASGEIQRATEAYQRLVAIWDTPYHTAQALDLLNEYAYVEGWIYLGERALAKGDTQAGQRLLSLAARELGAQLDELSANQELLKVMGAWNPEQVSRARDRAYQVAAQLGTPTDPLVRLRLAALCVSLGDIGKARTLAGEAAGLSGAERPAGWQPEDARAAEKVRHALLEGP